MEYWNAIAIRFGDSRGSLGRMRVNATFSESHAADSAACLWNAIDLTPVIADNGPSLLDFTVSLVERFCRDVRSRLVKMVDRKCKQE